MLKSQGIRRAVPVAPPFLSGLQLYLDSFDSTTITKAYQNLAATGSGTSGSTVITAASTEANLVQAGMKIRIGGTDIYTVASVSTVTINTVETLTANYVAQPMALDRVSQWNDKSGRGNHFTQGTALTQPVYNPARLNSNAVVTFDSNNHMLRTLASDITGTRMTVFCVCKRTSVSVNTSALIGLANGQTNDYDNVGSSVFFDETDGTTLTTDNNSAFRSTATHPGNGVAYIAATRFDGTNNTMYLNNVAKTPVACANTLAFHTLYLGTRYAAGVTAGYLGDISLILLYNRSLTSTEIIQVNKWIAQRTAIIIS